MPQSRATTARSPHAAPSYVTLRLRFFGRDEALGPGKVQLLELILREGSISAAGRAMQMSYHRAWALVDEMNALFREPVVRTQPGGSNGGGTEVTEQGLRVIREYRAMEAKLRKHTAREVAALEAAVAHPPSRKDATASPLRTPAVRRRRGR